MLEKKIRDLLPKASFAGYHSLFNLDSQPLRFSPTGIPETILKDAIEATQTLTTTQDESPESTLSLNEVSSGLELPSYASILDWGASGLATTVRLQPVDAGPLFLSDKTYWLIGLTGGLGLSLTDWMIEKGARNIVLSSRQPQVDRQWLEACSSVGANVHIWAGDVSNLQSNQQIFSRILETLPPLAGVAQGAMVLHDCLFADIDYAKFEKVLGPKVRGSALLEEVLGETDLDFMIYFSSMASVTGKAGSGMKSIRVK